jgi:anaerobic selenocysteine-containing dehydrogenase
MSHTVFRTCTLCEAMCGLQFDVEGERILSVRGDEQDVHSHGPHGDHYLPGRRELRTCNSWMHNVPALVAGRERCVLYVHPDDAARAGLRDGEPAVLESRVHSGAVPVLITDEVRPGVVSLPHGWGHAPSAPWQRVAGSRPGVSANDWTDDQLVESVVGQSILNGVPVRLRSLPQEEAAA